MSMQFKPSWSLLAGILLILADSSPAAAQPAVISVSGSIRHGESITIYGSGFGSHGDYNNLNDTWQGKRYLNFRFKDFEDGSLSSHGWTPGYTDTFSIRSGERTNSTFYAQGKSTSSNRQIQFGATVQGASATSQVFWSSFWLSLNGPVGSTGGKFYRHYLGPDSSRDDFFLATGDGDFYLRGDSEAAGTTATQWTSPSTFVSGQWSRIDVLTVASDGSLSVTVWKDGVQQWSHSNWGANLNYSPNGHTIDVPNMIGFETNTGTLSVDDIFIDFTQARVELCDSPTWSTRSHCEVQVPQSWSASAITVGVNQGSFSPGESVYLYVIDSGGATNAQGRRLTVGASSNAPSPPSNLRIQ